MNAERDAALSVAVRLREEGRVPPARERSLVLADRYPDDAEIADQTAWARDVLGLEAEAVPFYEGARNGSGPAPDDRHGVLLRLGSTYRVLGSHDQAPATLPRGLREFPGDAGLHAFLALTLYEARDAVRGPLKVLVAAGTDPRGYERAIDYYADGLGAR